MKATVRFCPWAPRRTRRNVVRTAASAIARGTMNLRTARAVFGVTRVMQSLRAPRATGRLTPSGLRSALGGAS
jgi:hypothetical protein